MTTEARVIKIDRHRNGIGGDPFYVALVEDEDVAIEGMSHGLLVVIVPERAVESNDANPESGLYEAFAIDPRRASAGDIAFGTNSWRGDHYFKLVVTAARKMRTEEAMPC